MKNKNKFSLQKHDGFIKAHRLTFILSLCLLAPVIQAEKSLGDRAITQHVSQNKRQVSGTVTDPDNMPLPGVNVMEKGTTNGTITDADGKFELRLQGDHPVLVFSYIGFIPAEIKVDNRASLKVKMSEDVTQMDEVVVIGYGTTTKKEVTGSITSLKEENFIQGNITNPLQLLQGQVAGMNIVKPNGGDPNGEYTIQLRGMTTLSGGASPLIVIDGIVGGSLESINPEEIESIDVLKDGSAAAIYGTRGTNGVILITTKKTKGGESSAIEFSTYAAIQAVSKKLDVLSADQFRQVINDYYPTMKDQYDYGHSTDWFDEVTRKNPLTQYYNLSFSGSAKHLGYRASLSYQDDQGLVNKTDKNKLRANLKVHQTHFNDRLTLDYNLNYSRVKGNTTDYAILQQAARRNPTEPVYDTENKTPVSGGYYYNPGPFQYHNPVAMINEATREYENRDALGSIKASFQIIDGLNVSAMGSLNQTSSNSGNYFGRYYPIGFGTNGSAEIKKSSFTNSLLEFSADYRKSFHDHNFQVIGGYSYNEGVHEESYSRNYLFDTDKFSYHNIGSGTALQDGKATMSSEKSSNKLIAFFGRFMYNYDEKYLLSASVRYEGSSRFGANNKWGTFPAVSAGWRLNKENFMKHIGWIDDLKIRVGYGVTGNQEIGNYQSLELLKKDRFFYYNGEWISTYKPASNPNPDLKWEKKGEFNIGLDFTLLKRRLGGAVDYYARKTNDLLYWYSVPVPPNLYNQLFTNVGSIKNSGIEVAINAVPVRTNTFQWNTNLTLSHNTNKLVKFSNKDYAMVQIRTGYIGEDFQQHTQRIVEGSTIGNFWGPRFLGVDDEGNNILEDLNEDGVINEEDYQNIGNAYPDLTFGFSNTFTYKNWDLSFLIRGAVGNDVLNVHRMYYEGFNYFGGKNILASTLEHPEYKGSAVFSDRFVENASYAKLDNLTLGYNFKLNTTVITKLRLYFTAQNLWTITGYKGIDPEVDISGLEPGMDWYDYYPQTRTFLIGLNLNF